jgi:hypothetical protein
LSSFHSAQRESILALRLGRSTELQAEMNQRLLPPVHAAEIEIWANQADLITYPVRDYGSVRVVKDNSLF